MPARAINPKSATGCMLVLIPVALTMSALFVAWPVILGVTLLIASGNIWQSYEWSKTARLIDPVFQELIIQNRGEISSLDLALKANVPGATSERYLVAKASEFGTGRRQHPERGQIYYFVTLSTLGRIFDDSELETPAIMPVTNPIAAIEPTVTQPQPISEVLLQSDVNSPVNDLAIAIPLETEATIPSVEASPPAPETSSQPAESLIDTAIESSQPTELSDQTAVASTESVSTDLEQPPAEVHADLPPPTSPVVLIIQSELAKRLDVHSSTIYKRRSEPNFTDWTRNRDPEGIAWGYAEATKEYYRIDT
jgi:hypothetical protein